MRGSVQWDIVVEGYTHSHEMPSDCSLQAKSVLVYDPLLSSQEKAALEKLGCINIHHNEVIGGITSLLRITHTLCFVAMPKAGAGVYTVLHAPLWTSYVQQPPLG